MAGVLPPRVGPLDDRLAAAADHQLQIRAAPLPGAPSPEPHPNPEPKPPSVRIVVHGAPTATHRHPPPPTATHRHPPRLAAWQAAFVSLFNAGWRTTLSIIQHYHDFGAPLKGHMAEIVAAQEAELGRLHKAIEELREENNGLRRELQGGQAAGDGSPAAGGGDATDGDAAKLSVER